MSSVDRTLFAPDPRERERIMQRASRTVITRSELEAIRSRASPLYVAGSATGRDDSAYNRAQVSRSDQGAQRASHWKHTAAGEREARLQRVEAHKKARQDEMLEEAAAWDARLARRKADVLDHAAQLEQEGTEYRRQLRSAKMVAEAAAWRVEAEKYAAQKATAEWEAGQAEKRELIAANEAQKAEDAAREAERKEQGRKVRAANEEIIRQKQDALAEEQKEKQRELEYMRSEAAALKEEQAKELARKQAKARQNKQALDIATAELEESRRRQALEERALDLEADLAHQHKEKLAALEREKKAAAAAEAAARSQRLYELTAKDAAESQQKREALLSSCELAEITSARHAHEEEERAAKSKRLAQECADTNLLIQAEHFAREAVDRMAELEYGAALTKELRDDEAAEAQTAFRAREEARKRCGEQKKELEDRARERAEREAAEKQADLQAALAEQEAVRRVRQDCLDIANQETDPSIRAAYRSVIRGLEKQESTISWQADL